MRKILIALPALALAVAPLTAADADSTYQVTVAANHSSIEKGQKVKLSGKVTGGKVKGQKVYVSALVGSTDPETATHKDYGTVKLSDSGKYSITIKPNTGGVYYFKVTKKKNGSTATGSKTKRVKVFRWTALINYYYGGYYNEGSGQVTATSGVKVKGTSYPHEFTVENDTSVGWNTDDKRCDKFRSYVGVADGSSDGAKAEYAVYQGDTAVQDGEALGTVTEGKAWKHFTYDIDNHDLKVDVYDFTQAGDLLVLGEPQVHCPVP